MPLTPYRELIAEDAASPVMVGFNGAYLPEVCRREIRFLRSYAQAAREAAEAAKVPVALLFNESHHLEWVYAAMESGFNAVMYTDERLSYRVRVERITAVVQKAHAGGIAVEAELGELPDSPQSKDGGRTSLTDPEEAERFARETGVDALGVSIGNRHSPGGELMTLDIGLIAELKRRLGIPLVLHAGSNVAEDSLRSGIWAGSPAAVYPGFAALGSGTGVDLLGGVDVAVHEKALAKLAILRG
jgi:fructose/tagatose bisphosphate aldolase